MAKYKTYKKEKRIYFALSIIVYFLPFTVTAACLLPFLKAAEGFKIAAGFAIVAINAIPFLMGIFRSLFAHFPMLNVLAAVFLMLAAFFKTDVFSGFADKLCWIELSAAVGSIASCILWAKYKKYSGYSKTMKATIKSDAFITREDNGD